MESKEKEKVLLGELKQIDERVCKLSQYLGIKELPDSSDESSNLIDRLFDLASCIQQRLTVIDREVNRLA